MFVFSDALHYDARMPVKRAASNGRPRNGARLVGYGLHLSPDKKDKLFQLKTYQGISVRDWVEGQIEAEYTKMKRKLARQRTKVAKAL